MWSRSLPNIYQETETPTGVWFSGRFEDRILYHTIQAKIPSVNVLLSPTDLSSCKCDTFTEQYMREHCGHTQFEPIDVKDESDQPLQYSKPEPLIPKNQKKNFQKMLDNDRKILRFSASMLSNRPETKDRVFVVSYYLADDTIGIYEPPQRYYHTCL